jgi:hypothetical protein
MLLKSYRLCPLGFEHVDKKLLFLAEIIEARPCKSRKTTQFIGRVRPEIGKWVIFGWAVGSDWPHATLIRVAAAGDEGLAGDTGQLRRMQKPIRAASVCGVPDRPMGAGSPAVVPSPVGEPVFH